MAKVKTAVEKLKAVLIAKGLSLDEVKDTINELESADADLEKAAEAFSNNEKWVNWYQQADPEIRAAFAERDQLKAQLQQLEAVGVKLTPAQQRVVEDDKPASKYVSMDELNKFKSDLANASSQVMKQMTKLSFKHYQKFNSEPDWDSVEKLITEGKAVNIEDAYRQWSKPMRDKAREEKVKKQIEEGIKQGVQDQISKLGIRPSRKTSGDAVEQELLQESTKVKSYKDMSPEEKYSYDKSLRDGFLNDINEEVTH